MLLLTVGLGHRRVAADVIAAVGAHSDALAASLLGHDDIAGLMPLVTCNRVEFHMQTASFPEAIEAVLSAVSEAVPERAGAVMEALEVWAGDDAVRHLFEVTSGLDSMVVGDAEITGQVRHALQAATATLTPDLTRLGQAALAAARTVNAGAGTSAAGRSLSSIGLDLALPEGRTWSEVRALVLGTGNYAGIVVADLLRRGCTDIAVHSGSGQAERFAATHPVRAVSDLAGAVADCDLVVASSGRREALLAPDVLGAHRPVVLDLTGGIDVPGEVGRLPGMRLVTIDDIAAHVPPHEARALAETRLAVDRAAEAFLAERRGRQAAATIAALRARVGQVIDDEVAAVSGRYPPEVVAAIERSLRRVSGTLLHDPTVRATRSARSGELGDYQEALARVLGIEVDQ